MPGTILSRPAITSSSCGVAFLRGSAQRYCADSSRLEDSSARAGDKPDSVPAGDYSSAGGGHLSGTPVPRRLMRPTRGSRGPRSNAPVFGLAPSGVYLASPVTRAAGELLPHRFTLAFASRRVRGLLSVALSVGVPPLGVTQRPALRSPDFPPARRTRASDRLPYSGEAQT